MELGHVGQERMEETDMVKETIDDYYNLRFLQRYLVGHKGYIAGGCFKNIFNNEAVKDLDIFFLNADDYAEAVRYFDERTAGYGFEGEKISQEDAEYIFIYENDNCKSYKDKGTGVRLELCRSIHGTPEAVIGQFDFTITKFALYLKTDETDTGLEIIRHEDFFKHLHLKRLVIDDALPYPMSTLERSYRYAKYGYYPCRESKLKLAIAIHGLNEDEIRVGRSLYKGVD